MHQTVLMPSLIRPAVAAGDLGRLVQPTLTVEELVVRPWRDDDAPAVLAAYRDPDIRRWHARALADEAEARELIGSWRGQWAAETGVSWAVTRDEVLVGRIGIGHLNLLEGTGEIAYWVVPAARGGAVAARAGDAVCTWMFTVVGLHRVQLDHSALNQASCRAAEKAGFRFEGTRRGQTLHEDGWHDMHLHARLAGDGVSLPRPWLKDERKPAEVGDVTGPDLARFDRPSDSSTGLPVVRSVYQPIVDLRTGDVLAYEALARGQAGGGLESPADLFAWAREQGCEADLDLACQVAAMTGALEQGLPASVPLFINAEPAWLDVPWPSHLSQLRNRAGTRLQVVVEITERALVADPAGLFAAVRRVREAGWGVALDDVGADPASLALMPFIDPDVIKLDLRLIQENTTAEIAAIINAVIAQAERTGATVLAEGIETGEHQARALAMGATLGQGWLLGRPGPLPGRPAVIAHDLSFTRAPIRSPRTPFEAIRDVRPIRTTSKGMLLAMSHHLENHALSGADAPVLLSTFEDAAHFTPATAVRYQELAQRCSFVAALGAGMSPAPVPGVRGADLAADDRLAGEWVVVVVGPHFGGALIARDLGDTGADRERRFEFAITYDRELVLDAARSLFDRIVPA
jgi:EAL domain-containing protein (putative c-di-GMP-specific phosphodiesterase class I)/RimJ/RimL family protein N-acetyltransferase